MTHYNTTNQFGEILELFKVKARTQDQIVLDLFRKHPDLTASECHAKFPNVMAPLTSIRRSITNLSYDIFTGNGTTFKQVRIFTQPDPMFHRDYALIQSARLMKTSQMRQGIYGKPEYVYKIIDRL